MQSKLTIWRAISWWMTPRRPLSSSLEESALHLFAPFLLDLDYNKKPLNVQLLYANRDNDFPYRKELEALRTRHPEFRIDYVVSPNRIDEKSIPQFVPDIEKPTLYVSGPEPMVQSMDEILKEIGVPEERIKNDFFPGYEWP